MAKKIEIIGQALVISDTNSTEVLFEAPKGEYYYNSKELVNEGKIKFYNLDHEDNASARPKVIDLSDAVDSSDSPFNITSFQTFARENLGFKTASGGSDADFVKSTTTGEPNGSSTIRNIVEISEADYNVGTLNSDTVYLIQDGTPLGLSGVSSGIEFTGGFAGKPLSNNYVWEAGLGINITQADVDAEIFKTFSLDSTVQAQVDTPYWTDPIPADHTGKGVFGGSYLPEGVIRVFDYTTVDSDTYEDGSNVATTGGFDFSQLKVGDKVEIRFDFNAIPQIANTTLQPAIWYKNRDANDNVTFTFPLTAQPIFYGTGTVGKTYLNRIEMSVYIASQEDINSLSHFAAKSDNPIIIQPLSCLLTIVR